MKELAHDFASRNGTIDQSDSIEIWKNTYSKLGLRNCPNLKVFHEFLASFKP